MLNPLMMVFPKKSLKLERLKKTRINKSDKSVHPNLQGFNPTPRIFEVYVFPPFGKAFKSSKQNLNKNFHMFQKKLPSLKELFVDKIESKGSLLPWRRATTSLQEQVEVSVGGKPVVKTEAGWEKLMLHTSVGKEHTSVSDWEIAV